MTNMLERRMEYGIPASHETMEWLLHNESARKVVRLMDIASLSTLELLEFGVTKQDIVFAFVNGVLEIDTRYINANPDPSVVSRIVDGRYDYWNSRKFVLSRLGLQLLDRIKGEDVPTVWPPAAA